MAFKSQETRRNKLRLGYQGRYMLLQLLPPVAPPSVFPLFSLIICYLKTPPVFRFDSILLAPITRPPLRRLLFGQYWTIVSLMDSNQLLLFRPYFMSTVPLRWIHYGLGLLLLLLLLLLFATPDSVWMIQKWMGFRMESGGLLLASDWKISIQIYWRQHEMFVRQQWINRQVFDSTT